MRDAVLVERRRVVGQVAAGEEARVDHRVQRLHPAVQHLGKGGDLAHVAHRQAGGAERLGGAAGGEELDLARGEPRGQMGGGRSCRRPRSARGGSAPGRETWRAPRARGGPSGRGGRLGDAAEGPGDLAQILDHLAADNHLRRRLRRRARRGRNAPSSSSASAPPPARNIQTSPEGRVRSTSCRPGSSSGFTAGCRWNRAAKASRPPGAARSNWLRARASATVRISSPRSSWPRAST